MNKFCWIWIVLAGLWASPALAQGSECVDDTDCDEGFVCEVTGAATCGSAGGAPIPAGCEGEDCPEPIDAGPPAGACEDMEFKTCEPAPCETDSDCSEGEACVTIEEQNCSGAGGCAAGESCDPVEPVCTTTTYTDCRLPWQAPCEADADCGTGFECNTDNDCDLIETACTTDDDCDTGLTCGPSPEDACSPPGYEEADGAIAGGAGTGTASSDNTAPESSAGSSGGGGDSGCSVGSTGGTGSASLTALALALVALVARRRWTSPSA